MKYQYKLFFSFSIVILILLIISATIFHQYNYKLIEDNTQVSQTHITQSIKEKMDRVLLDMGNLTKNIHASDVVMDIMKTIPNSKDNYFDVHPRENDNIKNLIYSLTITEDFSGRISIISRFYDYTYISNSYNTAPISKDIIRTLDRVKKGLYSDDYYTFYPPHKDHFSITDQDVLTVSRPLRDTYKTYGLVEYSKPLEGLDDILENSDIPTINHIALVNSNGRVIYTNFLESLDVDIADLYNPIVSTQSTGMYNWTSKGKRFSVCFSALDEVNWTVLHLQNMAPYNAAIMDMQKIITLSYLLAFIVLLVFIYFFSSSFTKPLKTLTDSTNNFMSQGELDFSPAIDNNEITTLSHAIQDMLDKIQVQNSLVVQAKESEVEAYLNVLQAQLNPHFLYNTLAVIGAYGQSTDNHIVADMCNELADILRYTITSANQEVTMEDEINNVKNYLSLMKMRYQHFVEYDIDVDESICNIPIPKLTLQPIVENCFKHGFKNIAPTWKIKIRYYQENDNWILKIQDNGLGFSDQEVVEVYKRFETLKDSIRTGDISKHIQSDQLGLINTLIRLYMFYDGKCQFSISNEDHMNTITFQSPL